MIVDPEKSLCEIYGIPPDTNYAAYTGLQERVARTMSTPLKDVEIYDLSSLLVQGGDEKAIVSFLLPRILEDPGSGESGLYWLDLILDDVDAKFWATCPELHAETVRILYAIDKRLPDGLVEGVIDFLCADLDPDKQLHPKGAVRGLKFDGRRLGESPWPAKD